jgi:Na+-transporting methylmalonyl-CoA/oxaloacetate decarboxylase gamma subunit
LAKLAGIQKLKVSDPKKACTELDALLIAINAAIALDRFSFFLMVVGVAVVFLLLAYYFMVYRTRSRTEEDVELGKKKSSEPKDDKGFAEKL